MGCYSQNGPEVAEPIGKEEKSPELSKSGLFPFPEAERVAPEFRVPVPRRRKSKFKTPSSSGRQPFGTHGLPVSADHGVATAALKHRELREVSEEACPM